MRPERPPTPVFHGRLHLKLTICSLRATRGYRQLRARVVFVVRKATSHEHSCLLTARGHFMSKKWRGHLHIFVSFLRRLNAVLAELYRAGKALAPLGG